MPRGYQVIEDDFHQTLDNVDHPEYPYKIWGYKENRWKKAIYVIFNVLFVGFPFVITKWKSTFKAFFLYTKVPLREASVICIKDKSKSSLIEVKTDEITLPGRSTSILLYFEYQYSKYVWSPENSEYVPFDHLLPPKTLNDILANTKGLFPNESVELLKFYGHNEITIEIKSYWKLFMEEVLSIFYMFQIFSVILWVIDDYYVYAGCVLFLLLSSAIISLYETRKQTVALYNVIKSESAPVQVLNQEIDGDSITIKKHPKDLVPGDVLLIPRTGCSMECDAILLTGMCMVNESSLTGESVPVTKTPPHAADEEYDTNTHKKHTLFAGTKIVQARFYGSEYVLARVCRTGFSTAKGSLVKSILFPAPVALKFYDDTVKFVVGLFTAASFGVSYCIYLFVSRAAALKEVIVRSLDIFTILVPPALPAAMTVGISFSQSRLKKKGIFCISPRRITLAGKVKLACFDKTGTLTNEGLELSFVIPYGPEYTGAPLENVTELNPKSMFLKGMATCHSLTSINNEIIGDPMDLAMFESTTWILQEPGSSEVTRYDLLAPPTVKPRENIFTGGDAAMPYELGIIQQFVFSSTQQCMSVIVSDLSLDYLVAFTKGAPEKVIGLCEPDSIPGDFYTQLACYTAQGYRMLALAYKELPPKFKWKDAQVIKRDLIECDLTFLGFIVMKNALKPETTPVIEQLIDADVRTVMITGDNVMTAVSVARDCKMIGYSNKVMLLKTQKCDEDSSGIPKLVIEGIGEEINVNNIDFEIDYYHFAIDGKTWDDLLDYYPDILPNILMHSTVFARFQPDQKTKLIKQFQGMDYIVSMVGDGANDCGALKAAHVGISLSQAEASVAAPFTSSTDNISCTVELIKEGKCSSVASIATFRYMVLYSVIQFISIIILYQNYSILGDTQFLFIDLVVTSSLACTISRQGPAKKLVAQRPNCSLLAGKSLIPMIIQIALCTGLQFGGLYYLRQQPWFIPIQPGPEEIILSWENSVIFLVSGFQYIVMAFVYSKGWPYRRSALTNFGLLFCGLSLIGFLTYLTVKPHLDVAKFFELEPYSHDKSHHMFRFYLMLFPLVHVFSAFFLEALLTAKCFPKLLHFICRKKQPKNLYKRLAKDTGFKENFRTDNNYQLRNNAVPIAISKKSRHQQN